MSCLSDLQQAFAEKIPLFDDPVLMAKFSAVQASHEQDRAMRAVLAALRKELKEHGLYEGSKLEIMDRYEIKQTELSSWPFYVLGAVQKASKGRVRPRQPPKRQKKQAVASESESFEEPAVVEVGVVRRSSRGRVPKHHYDDEYYE